MRITVGMAAEQLFVQAPAWPQRVRLYQLGDDRFVVVDEDVDMTFGKDPQRCVVELRVSANGQNVTAKKVR